MAVIGDQIRDNAPSNQALHEGDIDDPGRLLLPAMDRLRGSSGGMSKNVCSRATHCSRSCRRWTRTRVLRSRAAIIFAATTVLPNAVVAASTPVSCSRRAAAAALCSGVSSPRNRAVRGCPCWRSSRSSVAMPTSAEKAHQTIEASPREGDVLREQLGTRDDAWLAECRQSHRLRRVELRVLECGQPCDAVHQARRELRPIDVDLIAKHDLDRLREVAPRSGVLCCGGTVMRPMAHRPLPSREAARQRSVRRRPLRSRSTAARSAIGGGSVDRYAH